MLYYLTLLSAAAIVLLAANFRSESNRWAAFFLLCASLGGVAEEWLSKPGFGTAYKIAQLLNHTLTPYGVLVFSLVYAGGRAAALAHAHRLQGWLLLPPLATVLESLLFERLTPNFPLLLIWTAPYYLIACWLLVASCARERDRNRRRSRIVTAIITVPTLLGVLVFINIAKTVWPSFDFFRYVSVFIVYSFAIALLCVFVYGVLGVKVRVENDSLAGAMKAAGMGTSLLNHSIKNEAGKIAISVENLRAAAGSDPAAGEHLAVIERAASHLLEMAGRIHSQTRDFAWNPELCDPAALMREALDPLRERFAKQGVAIDEDYDGRASVLADPVHLREALGNVLANAADAMDGGGLLKVKAHLVRKEVVLSVGDNGPGMPPGLLERVWEPFYSTKPGKDNYGLGLSYVHQVARKCGGRPEIDSEPGRGTTVQLRLPGVRRSEEGRP